MSDIRIYDLFDLPTEVLASVGGKARGLFELSRAGLNVARGFVVCGANEHSDLTAVADYYEKNAYNCIAARSSATLEDGSDFSNAGQFSTFLNIKGRENVLEAVRDCCRSLRSETASSYSKNFLGGKKSQMTVVVQEMIEARNAGVCFTVNPVTNEKKVMIEAVDGLGEALVSGEKAAEQYILSYDESDFESKVKPTGALKSWEIEKIHADALRAKEFFGKQIDTEWAIDKGGQLVWLQARAVTTDESQTAIDEFDCDRDLSGRVITTCNIGEMLPGAVTPLSLSTSVYSIDWGMRKMLKRAGAVKSMSELPAYSCALSISNHLFIDMTTLYRLAKAFVMGSKESIDLSICGEVLEGYPDGSGKKKNCVMRLINGVKYMSLLLSRNKAKKKLKKIALELSFAPANTSAGVYKSIDEKMQYMNDALWNHYITSSHSGAMSSAISIVLKDDFADKLQLRALIAGILQNIDGIESVDILTSLREIAAEIIREKPNAKQMTAEDIYRYLETGKGESGAKYRSFLLRHGHRTIREAELRSRSWNTDRKALAEYLTGIVSSDFVPRNEDKDSWKHSLDILLASVKGGKKKAIKYLAIQARQGVINREYSKSYIIKVIDLFKQKYIQLAKLLVADSLLPDEDAIFFLTHAEIGDLIENNNTALVKKALSRRRLLASQMPLKFNEVNLGRPTPIEMSKLAVGSMGNSFKGVPVSRGVARGKARVVRTIEDARKIQKGEIMIAATTDIGWSPYYCLIEGLVTEIGSALSHGAVVAREYSLPVIVNAPCVTEIIKTGDIVAMDATSGIVTIETAASKQESIEDAEISA